MNSLMAPQSTNMVYVEVTPIVYVHSWTPVLTESAYTSYEAIVSWPQIMQNISIAVSKLF